MVRELARRTARRSYALTKWRMLRRLARGQGVPVVVFCMSKTASTAVFRAVQGATTRPVLKIHVLAPEAVARAEAHYRRTDPRALPRHVLHASHLMRHMPTAERPWHVVTIVREPVMRSVSDFFQSARRLGRLGDESTTRAALERFVDQEGIERTAEWFDRELVPSLGVDVYDHPFDPSVGYGIVETPAVKMLVLRQESLDAAPAALGGFLGLPGDVEIVPENVGAAKEYSELYGSVLRDLRFSEATLDRAYRTRYARHFYSPMEIEDLRQRWGTTATTPGS